MKALKIILWIVVILAVVIAILAVIAPKELKVERQIHIEAPAEIILDQLSHFENFEKWSPWSEVDPEMNTRIEGNDGEPGAVYYWEGNKKAGKGSQELTSVSNDRIEILLTFEEPYKSEANVYYDIVPDEYGTNVSWGFTSKTSFPWNIMGLFMNMEEMIGKDYDKGLISLKTISENMAAEYAHSYNIIETEFPLTHYLIQRETVSINELNEFFGNNYPLLYQMATTSELNVNGVVSAIYFDWDQEAGLTDVAAALPIDVNGITETDDNIIEVSGKALHVEYYGHYDEITNAYSAIMEYVNSNGYEITNWLFVEEYITDPQTEPDPANWHTNIYLVDNVN